MRVLPYAVVVLLITTTPARATLAEYDAAMLDLASASGCMACHSILPAAKRADGLAPIAPALRDVAVRYRNDPGASNRLTRTVMTGASPDSRHWVGKVGVVTMPPNTAAVSEADARRLVNWILVLVP